MVGFEAVLVAVVALLIFIFGGYHRVIVKPIDEEADDAVAQSDKALKKATRNEEHLDAVERTLEQQLNTITGSLEDISDQLDDTQMELRQQTYRTYQIIEAINESSDIDTDLDKPDPDEFLRGGSDD